MIILEKNTVMPIYMDIHEMPEGVNAKHVAEMHQADLKIEHEYNCRGLTNWCVEKRHTENMNKHQKENQKGRWNQ